MELADLKNVSFTEGEASSLRVRLELSDSTPLGVPLVLHYWTGEREGGQEETIQGNFMAIYYRHAYTSAAEGLDYRGVSRGDGTVTILAGSTEVFFSIEIYDDDELEPFEEFIVHPDGSPALPAPLTLDFDIAGSSSPTAQNDDLEFPDVVVSAGSGPFASFEIGIVDDDEVEGTECFSLDPVPGEGMPVTADLEIPFGLWFSQTARFCITDND